MMRRRSTRVRAEHVPLAIMLNARQRHGKRGAPPLRQIISLLMLPHELERAWDRMIDSQQRLTISLDEIAAEIGRALMRDVIRGPVSAAFPGLAMVGAGTPPERQVSSQGTESV